MPILVTKCATDPFRSQLFCAQTVSFLQSSYTSQRTSKIEAQLASRYTTSVISSLRTIRLRRTLPIKCHPYHSTILHYCFRRNSFLIYVYHFHLLGKPLFFFCVSLRAIAVWSVDHNPLGLTSAQHVSCVSAGVVAEYNADAPTSPSRPLLGITVITSNYNNTDNVNY